MNKAPHTGLTHPLVVAYLGDLERALSSTDAQERLDTVTAVTEHLTEALGDAAEPTTEQVQAVLDELGSVEQIANAAAPASASAESPTRDTERGQWVAPTLLAVSIVSLFIPLVGAPLAIGCLVTAIVLLRGDAPRRGMLRATIGVSIATLVFTAFMALGTLAWATFSVSTVTEVGDPVVVTSTAP
jgi:uncharacterized membrane protein